jgi:hypothetical protein
MHDTVGTLRTLFPARRGTIRLKVLLPSLGGEDFMSQKTFSLVVGLIFLLIAIMHGLRLAFRWEVVLNGWSVPTWVSAVALPVAAYLAFESLKLSKRS